MRSKAGQRVWRPVSGWRDAALGRVTVAVATLVYVLYLVVPWRPPLTEDASPDASWQLVLHTDRGQRPVPQSGRDTIFTFGPLGFLAVPLYYPATYGTMIGASVAFAATFWWGCWAVGSRILPRVAPSGGLGGPATGRPRSWLFACWLVGLASLCGSKMENVFLPSFGILLVVYHFYADDRPGSFTKLVLAAAVGAAALTKFSCTVAGALSVAAVGADELRRKRLPWSTAAAAIAFLTLYLLSGQRLSSLASYIHWSAKMASGYGAMARNNLGTWADAYAFVACAAVLVSGCGLVEWRVRRWAGATPVLALVGFLYLAFRVAVVRHDIYHAVFAPVLLTAVGLLYGPVLLRALPGGRGVAWYVAVIVLPAVVSAGVVALWTPPAPLVHVAGRFASLPERPMAATDLPRGSPRLRGQYEAGLAQIRADWPVPPVSGSVDVYPNNQAVAVAYGLDYRHRPVPQSYAAFTAELAEVNARFLRGPAAPDNVLFDVNTIDDRFPSLDDGLSWPELLTRYDVADDSGRLILLTKARQPRLFSLVPLGRTRGFLDNAVPVPADAGGPVWAQVEVRETIAGAFMRSTVRPAPVTLRIDLRDGKSAAYRLIPDVARAGFLLSPVVADRHDFARLLQTRDAPAGREVSAITVCRPPSAVAGLAYQKEVNFSFFRLDFPLQNRTYVHGASAPVRRATPAGTAETPPPGDSRY